VSSVSSVSTSFQPVVPGHALGNDAPAPATPKNIPHRGGAANPSADALAQRFGAAIARVSVGWGETTVIVDRASVHDIIRWLHDDPSQRYDYLSDVTAVEFRDLEQPIEVVWHLRSLPYRRFIRIKVLIQKGDALDVPSVWDVYKGADWLERECYDMFGITFSGHPDLRRLLMWERYKEGFPLRKDFPLRGRFSRSEQLRQALAANPEARYSKDELSIAEAFEDLPTDMQRRLQSGETVGE
jgi:NADH-quinone oxidoreductase subunit C